MSKILFAWELGGYLGHLTRLLPIALKLRDNGHDVSFLIKNLSRAELILGEHQFKTYQAPVWLLQPKGIPHPPQNYAEILMQFGYLDNQGLLGMVKAWRNTFELIKPDFVMFDHAPTGLLASRDLNVPRAIIGGGFFTPPNVSPPPKLRPWSKVDEKRLSLAEKKVVDVINYVLLALSSSPIKYLYDLFQTEQNFLTTVPELDFYKNRTMSTYWGPIQDDVGIKEPVWANHPGKKIFAYLKPEYEKLDMILQALKEKNENVLVFSPNLPKSMINQYQNSHFNFSREPFLMSKVIQECDLVISHAGEMLTRILLGGKPQLLFPMQLEQYTSALRAEELGAALVCDQQDDKKTIEKKLTSLLSDTKYTERASQFAEKYQHFTDAPTVDRIVDECEKILKISIK